MTIDYFKRHSNSFFEGKKATLTVEYQNGFGEVIPAGSTVTLLRKSGSHSAFDIVWHVKIGGEFQQVNIDSVLCMDLQLIHQQKMKKANLIIPTLFSIPFVQDKGLDSSTYGFLMFGFIVILTTSLIFLLIVFFALKNSVRSYLANKNDNNQEQAIDNTEIVWLNDFDSYHTYYNSSDTRLLSCEVFRSKIKFKTGMLLGVRTHHVYDDILYKIKAVYVLKGKDDGCYRLDCEFLKVISKV